MPVTIKSEHELGRLDLGRGEFLVLRDVEYAKGGRRFDIRKFYTANDESLQPTSKGASLKPEWLPQLRAAVEAFEKALQ